MDYFEFFNVYYVYNLYLLASKFKAIRWNVTRLHYFSLNRIWTDLYIWRFDDDTVTLSLVSLAAFFAL